MNNKVKKFIINLNLFATLWILFVYCVYKEVERDNMSCSSCNKIVDTCKIKGIADKK